MSYIVWNTSTARLECRLIGTVVNWLLIYALQEPSKLEESSRTSIAFRKGKRKICLAALEGNMTAYDIKDKSVVYPSLRTVQRVLKISGHLDFGHFKLRPNLELRHINQSLTWTKIYRHYLAYQVGDGGRFRRENVLSWWTWRAGKILSRLCGSQREFSLNVREAGWFYGLRCIFQEKKTNLVVVNRTLDAYK